MHGNCIFASALFPNPKVQSYCYIYQKVIDLKYPYIIVNYEKSPKLKAELFCVIVHRIHWKQMKNIECCVKIKNTQSSKRALHLNSPLPHLKNANRTMQLTKMFIQFGMCTCIVCTRFSTILRKMWFSFFFVNSAELFYSNYNNPNNFA